MRTTCFFVVASNALIPSLRTRGQGGLGSFMKYGFLGSYPEKVTTFVKVSLPHRCHTGSLLLGHRVLDVRLGVCRPALVYPCSLVFCFSSISRLDGSFVRPFAPSSGLNSLLGLSFSVSVILQFLCCFYRLHKKPLGPLQRLWP